MFGRLRPSSSSLDSLEMERSHSKFFKDDSLSVYEATLMKLKLGSQRAILLPDDPMDAETDSVIPSTSTSLQSNSTNLLNSAKSTSQPLTTMAGNCSSSTISPASSASLPASELRHQVSVLELFSKYKVSRQDESISSQGDITTMTMDDSESENNLSSSVSFPCLGGSSSSTGYSAD